MKLKGKLFWSALLGLSSVVQAELATNVLYSSWGKAVTPENVWREYPRPQLVRSNWMSLNGKWDYAIASAASDEPKKYDGKILVPFAVEAPLSGVRRKVSPHDQIWYKRTFTLQPQTGCRTILNFERVDFRAQVFVNGVETTDFPHAGGNVPFSIDVTDFVKAGENELKVLVWDPTEDFIGGTGKQLSKYWTCFFEPVSGICGSVWCETVPETYLKDYHVVADADSGVVKITPYVTGKTRACEVTAVASFGGKEVASGRLGNEDDSITLQLPKPLHLWCCATPNLYDLAITVKQGKQTDSIKGYFGVRKVETKLDKRGIRRAAINGEFVYFLATLDQGWWPEGYLTPPSEAALRWDVDFHKKAGFNSIRKHIKVEPRAFYAHCDKVGIMVLQDMPSWGADNRQHDLQFNNKRYGFYRRELKDVVDHLRNHPSIVMWIAFNEGWGQPSADKTRFTFQWLKRYDPTRLLDGPSGWNDYEGGFPQGYTNWKPEQVVFQGTSVDVIDRHNYPQARMFPASSVRVSMAGEFGGLGASLRGHCYDPQAREHRMVPVEGGNWRENNRHYYEQLCRPLIEMAKQGLGGSVFTESIDQFWEWGGIVTFDRAIVKLDWAFMQKLHGEILEAARRAANGEE